MNHNPELTLELEAFKNLKNKVSAVITTNYDCLLEKSIFADDYSVFIHQNDLFSADSYNSAEIYKIHGCVTDADSMCFERYHSIVISRLLPVFKYVKRATSPIAEDSKLQLYINKHNSMELIIPTKIKKTLSNIPILESIDDIKREIDNVPDTNRKCGVILKNIGVLKTDEIRKLCIPIFMSDTKAAMSSTNFKRCVMCIDLLENGD